MEELPKAAGADHLTAALRRSGALGAGHVRGVVVESARSTVLSRILRLRLSYEGAAAGAPESLILKTLRPGLPTGLAHAGRQEAAFYAQVASATPGRLVPRCHEAAWDDGTRDWHLLLEDLSESHLIATAWPLPPSLEQCQAIMRARARFHAVWWDDPRLGASIGSWSGEEALRQSMTAFAGHLAKLVDRFPDLLSPARRDTYERLMAAEPRLARRYLSHRHHTIIHGDAHVWNCFLPSQGDDALLFDWDCWRVDTATDDLAYMMALHWYPDLRARFERPLLDSYHDELVAQGVRGYDRAALEADYRLSVLWQLTTPIRQAAQELPPVIWWNHMERICLAVEDLGCRDLL